MFIGHFAVAFAVKRAAPEIKLGTAIVAVTLLDLIWPILVWFGIEVVKIDPGNMAFTPLAFVHYPYSHSLAMTIVWGTLFAGVYYAVRRSPRAAIWLAAAVISHWFLDLIVHRPDLPIAPGLDIQVGLGLWNSVAATLIVESLLFAAGLGLYLSATRARDAIGTWGLWGLVALLLVSYVAAAFGPPPPNVTAIVIADLVGTAVTVIFAYWVDNHRVPAIANEDKSLN